MERKNITIADVAEALGVSKTTVSRAISGKGRIGDGTRERVLQYIEEHDYKPNLMAKGLANSCTYNIGVVMPENYGMSDAAFFVNCLAGLHEAAAVRGYDILLTVCDNVNMSDLERMVANQKVDGVVLTRTFMEDKAIMMLQERHIPFVVVGTSSYPNVVQIDQDNEEACRELTSILLMKRLRRIALLGGDSHQVVTQKRLKGFTEAHEMMNVPLDTSLIYMDHQSPLAIKHAVAEILKKEADCIICMDDNICVELLNRLKKMNVAVPDEIKVASFFNSTLLESNTPSITTLSFDVRKLGAVSARTLIDMIEKKNHVQVTLLGYEVILKESTK